MNEIRSQRLNLILLVLLTGVMQLSAAIPPVTGTVTYISSTHVYVKFSTTEGLLPGDTLYTKNKGALMPAILIKNTSSLSCMGIPIDSVKLVKGTAIVAFPRELAGTKKETNAEVPIELKADQQVNAIAVTDVVLKENTAAHQSKLSGRVSLASYSHLSTDLYNSQRLRYTVSLRTGKKEEKGLSTETYLAYNQRLSDYSDFQHDLKIYSLAVNYRLNKSTSLSLGRKLNPGMANIGAVDGVQLDIRKGALSFGAVAGSRPDTQNYGYNAGLFQAGAYAAHETTGKQSSFQTTIALMNQFNNRQTDRRFVYLQHSNQIANNLSMFASVEMDLYAVENGIAQTTFDLTGAFLSLRYKFSPRFSLSANYDARRNVYYYETYKNTADSIFDKETRQGVRGSFHYRLSNDLSWTGTMGYRMPVVNGSSSLHGNTSFTMDNLFVEGGSLAINAMGIRTDFMDGVVAGGEYSYDFTQRRIALTGEYQFVNYWMQQGTKQMMQHIAELSIAWRFNKKWLLAFSAETTFERTIQPYSRLYLNLTRRF